jgi:iron uptake system component EfeO
MKAAWKKARTAYERIEGAIAPIFPDTDAAIDERYDGFMEKLGAAGDPNLFDAQGVRGMHGIERILFHDTTPANVKQAEAAIPGYRPAAYPATAAEADDFKTKLCEQLVADVTALEAQWRDVGLDLPGAFQGLVDLMSEQREKVNNASAGFEESRYAQVTMADLRNNFAGTTAAWELFHEWLDTKSGGAALHQRLDAGFAELQAAYDAVPGEAIPAPPATWSAELPSAADLETDFGRLYTKVRQATDASIEGSIVDGLNDAGALFFGAQR